MSYKSTPKSLTLKKTIELFIEINILHFKTLEFKIIKTLADQAYTELIEYSSF